MQQHNTADFCAFTSAFYIAIKHPSSILFILPPKHDPPIINFIRYTSVDDSLVDDESAEEEDTINGSLDLFSVVSDAIKRFLSYGPKRSAVETEL